MALRGGEMSVNQIDLILTQRHDNERKLAGLLFLQPENVLNALNGFNLNDITDEQARTYIKAVMNKRGDLAGLEIKDQADITMRIATEQKIMVDVMDWASLHEPGKTVVDQVKAAITELDTLAAVAQKSEELAQIATAQPDPDAADKKRILGAEYVRFLETQGYTFRLCDLDDSLWVNDERMTDALDAEIKTNLRDHGYNKVNVAADACLAHANGHKFHPIKDYLNSLTWGGYDHIGDLATFFTDRHNNFSLILRKWLIGAVARVMTGGEQNRVMVIEGLQEIGKSYFARWLGSPLADHFSEAPPDPDNKDSRLALATTWVWEIKELGSVTRRADREALKAWLTLESISERPPFGKYPIYKPAITSFVATVNNEGGFFNDPTGSRRYMTAAVTSIDWDYANKTDVNQVWAQALHLFEGGEDWNLTPEEKARIEAVNDEYEFTPPVYDWLDMYIQDAPGEFTPSDDILQAMKRAGVNGSDIHLSRQVGGWMKKHLIEDGRQYLEVYVEGKDGQRKKVSKRVRGYFGVELTRKAYELTGQTR
jgi:hypothetical protein